MKSQKYSSHNLNPKFTFETFVVGPSNEFAYNAAIAIAKAPGGPYNPFYIYGGEGLGRTHLMQAIGHRALESSRVNVCFVSSETFLNEYIDAIQNKSLPKFRKKYRNTDILLVDDVHYLANKERTQEEFFHTFNTLFDARKQIVMTSNRPACKLSGLKQQLVSRFNWGLVAKLTAPDLKTRTTILQELHKRNKNGLDAKMMDYIARNIKTNVRRLEGAFILASSYEALCGHELKLNSIKYLLRDLLDHKKLDL